MWLGDEQVIWRGMNYFSIYPPPSILLMLSRRSAAASFAADICGRGCSSHIDSTVLHSRHGCSVLVSALVDDQCGLRRRAMLRQRTPSWYQNAKRRWILIRTNREDIP
jgi:hypothetical protein